MMKKTIAILSLVLVLALLATGCAPKAGGTAVKQVNAGELTEALMQQQESPATMAAEGETLQTLYGLQEDLFTSYSANAAMMNVHAFELSVFQLKDEKDVQRVKEACAQRAGQIAQTFEQYLPDQYEAAKNPVIESVGNYVFFCISAEPEAGAYFDAFKKQIA
nr:DUF4358 domain-containing protein [Maliibacterium massiliense]